MEPHKLGLPVMSMRFERGKIVLCWIAGLYSGDDQPGIQSSDYVHWDRGVWVNIIQSIYNPK